MTHITWWRAIADFRRYMYEEQTYMQQQSNMGHITDQYGPYY